MTIRVLILASSLALRTGLRALLNADEDVEVIADLSSTDELDDLDGFDVLLTRGEVIVPYSLENLLIGVDPPPALLLLSDELERAQSFSRLALRAWGVLPPDCSEEELLAAVHALHEGLLVGSPLLMKPTLTTSPVVHLSESETLVEELTPRENEVLQLLAQGLANKQIALELGISEHTIKFHSSAIYSKLGVTNRTEAVRRGARLGLIVL